MEEPRARRVSDLLEEGFDSFSRSQKAIARYIIDHLDEIGYLSAEELARKGNTSSSTVVRFAQSLGFAGYPELQKAARDEYRLGAGARPIVHDDQLLFVVEEDFLTRALKTDMMSLEETLGKNSLGATSPRPLEALAGARQLAHRGVARGGHRRPACLVPVRAAGHPFAGRHGRLGVQRGATHRACCPATLFWLSDSGAVTR